MTPEELLAEEKRKALRKRLLGDLSNDITTPYSSELRDPLVFDKPIDRPMPSDLNISTEPSPISFTPPPPPQTDMYGNPGTTDAETRLSEINASEPRPTMRENMLEVTDPQTKIVGERNNKVKEFLKAKFGGEENAKKRALLTNALLRGVSDIAQHGGVHGSSIKPNLTMFDNERSEILKETTPQVDETKTKDYWDIKKIQAGISNTNSKTELNKLKGEAAEIVQGFISRGEAVPLEIAKIWNVTANTEGKQVDTEYQKDTAGVRQETLEVKLGLLKSKLAQENDPLKQEKLQAEINKINQDITVSKGREGRAVEMQPSNLDINETKASTGKIKEGMIQTDFDEDVRQFDEEMRYKWAKLNREDRPNSPAQAAATRATLVARNKQEDTLFKRFVGDDRYKNTYKSLETADRIMDILGNPSGTGDIAMIFSFIKNLDDTAVREGEVRLFQTALSATDRGTLIWKNLKEGDKLTPGQRRDLAEITLNVAKKRIKRYDEFRADHLNRSAQYEDLGVRPESTVVNFDTSIKDFEKVYTDMVGFPPGKSPKEYRYDEATDQTQVVFMDGTVEVMQGDWR